MYLASGVGVAAFLARMLADPSRAGFKPVHPESIENLRIAKLGPLGLGKFWYGPRPVLYPTLLWLTGANSQRSVFVQTVLYCVAALFLASTVARLCRSRIVGTTAAIAVIGLLTLPKYTQWSVNLFPESIATTVTLFMTACWLRFAAWPSGRRAIAAGVTTTMWVLVRDGNSTIAFVICAFTFGDWAIGRVSRRRNTSEGRSTSEEGRSSRARLLLGIAIVAFFASVFSVVSNAKSDRGRDAINNIVGLEVLPNDQLKSEFTSQGMPMSAALESRTGKDALADNGAFATDPALAPYREWVDGLGSQTVRAYISNNLRYHTIRLTRMWDGWDAAPVTSFDTFGTYSRWPHIAGQQSLTGHSLVNLILVALFAVVVGLIASKRGAARVVFVTLGALMVASLFEVFSAFVGDPSERFRHTIAGQLRIEVVVLIAVAVMVDQLVSRAVPVLSANRLSTDKLAPALQVQP